MNRRRGFTLVEMLVVIAIVLLLMSLLAVFLVKLDDSAKGVKTGTFLHGLEQACGTYKVEFAVYPPDTFGDSRSLHHHLGREWRKIIFQNGGAATSQRPPFFRFGLDHLEDDGVRPIDPEKNPRPVIDAWGNRIHYANPGKWVTQGVDLVSSGINGRFEFDTAHPDFDDHGNVVKDY